MDSRDFIFRVLLLAPDGSPLTIKAIAAGISASEALGSVEERLARHKAAVSSISPSEDESFRRYGQVLSADWAVSLADASLDLPNLSTFIELPDTESLEVMRFDRQQFAVELQAMVNDSSHCVAVLDGASTPNIAEILETSTLEHECLFRGDARAMARSAAPWLVRLRSDSRMAQRMIRAALNPDAERTIGPAMFLQTSQRLDEVADHFRRITRIQAESDGRWLYFRFADSDTMDDLRVSMSPEDAARVLGNYTITVPRSYGAMRMRRRDDGAYQAARNAAFRLSERHIRAFQHRERAAFAKRMEEYVLARFPRYFAPFVERLVAVGMSLCRDSGLIHQDTTAGYIMLSAHLGLEFPRRYNRLSAVLDPTRPEADRKTMIHMHLRELERRRLRNA